jgi:hypothetical protein
MSCCIYPTIYCILPLLNNAEATLSPLLPTDVSNAATALNSCSVCSVPHISTDITYRIYSHNWRTFFPILAAEKSGCLKCADFFGGGLDLLFVSSNNARWIPEFRILFLLHGSRTVPRNLSLLICTTLYNY